MEHYSIARGKEAVSQEYAKGKRAGFIVATGFIVASTVYTH